MFKFGEGRMTTAKILILKKYFTGGDDRGYYGNLNKINILSHKYPSNNSHTKPNQFNKQHC